jgi:hypothetical protein
MIGKRPVGVEGFGQGNLPDLRAAGIAAIALRVRRRSARTARYSAS